MMGQEFQKDNNPKHTTKTRLNPMEWLSQSLDLKLTENL